MVGKFWQSLSSLSLSWAWGVESEGAVKMLHWAVVAVNNLNRTHFISWIFKRKFKWLFELILRLVKLLTNYLFESVRNSYFYIYFFRLFNGHKHCVFVKFSSVNYICPSVPNSFIYVLHTFYSYYYSTIWGSCDVWVSYCSNFVILKTTERKFLVDRC